jgi:fermentation-respiration switch protein FrsA (DUF1100 family)
MKTIRNFLIITTILTAAGYGFYKIVFRLLEKAMLITRPNGPETPADAGLKYDDFFIKSGNRRLQAWFVKAEPSGGVRKAMLIYHGINESISDWVPALHFLWQHGVSAMVFDYSGFGNSEGHASLANLRQDAQAAYRVFMSRTGEDCQKYALGYSLGTGVLLEAAPHFACPLDGLFLVAGYSSARDAAVQMQALPARFTFIIPDVFNNVQAIRQVRTPLLIVHSLDDQLFPVTMPERIYAAANDPRRLVMLKGIPHNGLVEGKAAEYLAPVVGAVNS